MSIDPELTRVVIGDIHGDVVGLGALLQAIGVIDADARRQEGFWVVQLGDLLHMGHGEMVRDRDTALFSNGLFDVQLVGNHELWHAYGLEVGRFAGIDDDVYPETREMVRSWIDDDQLLAACELDGWLVSHAGVHSCYASGLPRDPSAAADRINERFRRRLSVRRPVALFDAIGYDRGGSSEHGGIFWEDFELLARNEANPWRQIVGHTPQRHVRCVDGRMWCVDVGAALSGCVPALVKQGVEGEWEPVVVQSQAG
jgi:Calcineurin-like phosphoesterase